jgi:hypothetical protein
MMNSRGHNYRAGVGAGLAFLFAFDSHWPGTTQRHRWAARLPGLVRAELVGQKLGKALVDFADAVRKLAAKMVTE